MTTARFTVLFLILAMLTLAGANNYKHPPTRTDTYDQAIPIQAGAKVLDIIDGDTIRVEAHQWVGHTWTGLIRLRGIDTPELRGSQCQEEKVQGILARDTLVSLVPSRVHLVTVKPGKFAGRFVATSWPTPATWPTSSWKTAWADPTSRASGNPGATNPRPASGNATDA